EPVGLGPVGLLGDDLLDDTELLEADLARRGQVDRAHAAARQGLEQNVLPELEWKRFGHLPAPAPDRRTSGRQTRDVRGLPRAHSPISRSRSATPPARVGTGSNGRCSTPEIAFSNLDIARARSSAGAAGS